MATNTRNYARFYALLKQMPGKVEKDDLIWQFTGMRTNSLRDMTAAEYDRMIKHMDGAVDQNQPDEKVIKKLRSGILMRLQRHGVNTADWAAVNRFMLNPRIAGKALYQMSIDEMQRLIPRLEQILIKDREQQREIARRAFLN